MADVSLFAALGAGVLSFISPCVLPLVPGYISYVSGVSFDEMRGGEGPRGARSRRQMLVTSAAFVLGFSLVFIGFGASASALGHVLIRYRALLGRIAGAVVIVFGLHLAGVFRIAWLDRDTRMQTSKRPAGPVGAVLVGIAFAFGWTPCIGPILGGILSLAAEKNTVGEGTLLLAVYSAGLGIPFLATSLAVDKFFVASARIRRHYRAIELVAGLLLVVLGALIFANRLAILSSWTSKFLPTF
jgi:cytochrome c-type biogenesis protein